MTASKAVSAASQPMSRTELLSLLTSTARKLPPEGQSWINGMTEHEKFLTATILEREGEAHFLADGWKGAKAELDHAREF